jgi:hypothetical protein
VPINRQFFRFLQAHRTKVNLYFKNNTYEWLDCMGELAH